MKITKTAQPASLERVAILHDLVDVSLFGRIKRGRTVLFAVRFDEKKTNRKVNVVRSSAGSGLERYRRMIKGFLDGTLREFPPIPLDMSGYPPFSRKVLGAARRVPYGKTVSYARLAAIAGNPRAVRAAASVMRRNRFPLVIPCHRVIKSDGSPGGFLGEHKGRGARLKKLLLNRERPES